MEMKKNFNEKKRSLEQSKTFCYFSLTLLRFHSYPSLILTSNISSTTLRHPEQFSYPFRRTAKATKIQIRNLPDNPAWDEKSFCHSAISLFTSSFLRIPTGDRLPDWHEWLNDRKTCERDTFVWLIRISTPTSPNNLNNIQRMKESLFWGQVLLF